MDFAKGLPDRNKVSPLPTINKPKVWTLSIQEHKTRNGIHYDTRLSDPDTKIAHSWASRKNPLDPEKKTYLIRQPSHTMDYALNFEGTIPSGYGKGEVKIIHKEPVQINRSHEKAIHFTRFDGRNARDFVAVDIGGKDNGWMLIEKRDIVSEMKKSIPPRGKYKPSIDLEKAFRDKAVSLAPKIDGALATLIFRGGQPPRVFSPRESKRGDNLEYTHKLDLISEKTPKEFDGIVARGEVYGTSKKTGKVIPLNQLTGILNSSSWKSMEKSKDITLRVALFPSLVSVKGKPPEVNLERQREITKRIAGSFGDSIHPVEFVTKEQDKRRLVASILAKRHPLTEEGVIAYQDGAPLSKSKFLDDEFDVHIRGFESGKGRLKNSVGAIMYSHTPRGKIVGSVGSGLTDAIRKQISEDPDAFLGRVAKVKAQGKFISGALRAPRFTSLHSDK